MVTAISGTGNTSLITVEPSSAPPATLAWAVPDDYDAGASWGSAPMCLEDRLCEIFARLLTQMQDDLLQFAEESERLGLEYANQPDGPTHEQGERLKERHRLEQRGWDMRTEMLDMYLGMADSLKESAEKSDALDHAMREAEMNIADMTIEMLENVPLDGLEAETKALVLRLRARKEPTVELRVQEEREALIDGVLAKMRAPKARATDARDTKPRGLEPAARPPRSANLWRGDS